MKQMSGEILLAAVMAFSLLLPGESRSQEILQESRGAMQIQYVERAEQVGKGEMRQPEKDWYENAFEDYEESPYGYYEEDAFYGDFDLDYWQRDSQADWYENRFYEYGRGYIIPGD